MINLLTSIAASVGIPPIMLIAVCSVENNFRNTDNLNDCRDGATSYGLCQIKLASARQEFPGVTVRMLKEPSTNALAAALYLKWQLDRYGRHPCRAISAYNVGHLAFNEERNYVNYEYVRKVKKRARHFGGRITCAFPRAKRDQSNRKGAAQR